MSVVADVAKAAEMIQVTDREYEKTVSISLDQEGQIPLANLKQYFPGAAGLTYFGEDDNKQEIAVLYEEEDTTKKLLPPDGGWNKIKMFYIYRTFAFDEASGRKRRRVDEPVDIKDEDSAVMRCRDLMLYILLEKQSSGEFAEGTQRKCATIASESIALTAGHCLPDDLPNDYPINLYDEGGNIYVVNAIKVGKQNDDFAILKIVKGSFTKFPNCLAMPTDGERYFILGYDAEYPNVSHLSCFSGRFRNTKILPNQNFVIGSPGTTDGCSGGGVFNTFGHLLGICFAGKLDWSVNNNTLCEHLKSLKLKLSQPSYSHIVPANYLMGIADGILK